jgi:carboxymethylenebutenolidase
MRLESGWVEFPVGETRALAYRTLSESAAGPLPAVVLVQEVWGVDDHITDLAGRFAAAGYLAWAPDLFSLGGARPQELAPQRVEAAKRFLDTVPHSSWWDARARDEALGRLPAAEGDELRATFARLLGPRDVPAFVRTLRAAVAAIAGDEASTGRVGAAGWCMGGALVGQLACHEPDLRAAVVFYGAAPDLADVPSIACPVMGFYGGDDPTVTGAVPVLAEAMRGAGKDFTRYVFKGAPHAFFNDTRAAYDVDAARQAWAHTLSFLCEHLSGPLAEREVG